MKFGLIGFPITHSMSPALFRAGYPSAEHSYELVCASEIEEAFLKIEKGNFAGVNVTAPFKESVLKFVNSADSLAGQIGASNLILRNETGFTAYNTDYFGVQESIKEFYTPGLKLIVTGCGGAGRAAALAARDLGFDVTIINRDIKKASDFALKSSISFASFDQFNQLAQSARIIIDTLPVLSELYNTINLKSKIVFEAKYSTSALKTKCIEEGAEYLPGTLWLLNQALPSFLMFTGEEPDRNAMELLAGNR